MKMMMRLSRLIAAVIAICVAPAPVAAQGNNPMWSSGYAWQCQVSTRIVCERDGQCKAEDESETFEIDYENNRLEFDGESVRIRRHYQQRINDSPLQAEVKIELTDNRVLWLTAVDGSRTYSEAWVGALTSPQGGVVLMISEAAYCLPKE